MRRSTHNSLKWSIGSVLLWLAALGIGIHVNRVAGMRPSRVSGDFSVSGSVSVALLLWGLGACVLVGLFFAYLAGRARFRAREAALTQELARVERGRDRAVHACTQLAARARRRVQTKHEADETLRQTNAQLVDALRRERSVSMELEAALQQLAAASQEALAATRAKSDFLANMSHEVRTPLTAIKGFLELIEDDISGLEKGQRAPLAEHVATVSRNTDYLLTVVNDVLDLAKIESGETEIEYKAFDPWALIEDIQTLLGERARQKGLRLIVEAADDLPRTVVSDPKRTRQVLLNLIGNAIKFTHQGSVRVVVRRSSGSSSGDRAVLCFEIIDTGIGMSAAQIERLFQPFVQADATTTREFGGTGLGLAISRRFARLMGGDVAVTSELGVGSRFVATIDVALPKAPTGVGGATDHPVVRSQTAAVPAASRSLEAVRILLAEDGVDNQRLIAHVLKRHGAVVTVTSNGREALDAVSAAGEHGTAFDVVLMDMQMPILDGYQATRQLRQADYRGPIIALTAHAMVGDREKCLAAGCDDYASKPVDQAGLLGVIQHQLQQAEFVSVASKR